MKLIEKYFLKQLAANCSLLFLLILSIFSLSKSVQLIDLSINRGLPFIFFIKLIGLSLPAIVPIVLPVIFCLSINFTYSRMKNDSELIIFESSGTSILRLAKPVIYFGLFLSILSFSFTWGIAPSSNKTFKLLLYSIKNDYSSSLLEEGSFNNIGSDYTIYVKERDSLGNLNNIFIHDTRNKDKPSTLIANKGSLLKSDYGTKILLENGTQHFYSNLDKKLSVLYFEKYLLNIIDNSNNNYPFKWKTPSERNFHELKNPDLENGDDRNNLQAFRSEIVQRITLPVNICAFGFLIVVFILSQKFYRIENLKTNLKVLSIILLQMAFFVLCSNVANKKENFELLNILPCILNFALAIKILNKNVKKSDV